jgi:predicted SAM-dependent methyltransferase
MGELTLRRVGEARLACAGSTARRASPSGKGAGVVWKVAASVLNRLLHTRIGHSCVDLIILALQYRVFSPRTVHAMRFDSLRLRARTRHRRREGRPGTSRLHLGCGSRRITGWLNVDVAGSDEDVDLAAGMLPWADGSFDVIVSQQVIEHLDLISELVPLFRELHRVCKPGAEIWLACPDLAKACRYYDVDKGASLLADRDARAATAAGPNGVPADAGLTDAPVQHFINAMFHQMGEHKNLLDFELIEWLCKKTGFGDCRRVSEKDLLTRFPEFPARNDDYTSIYVRATAGS